MGTPRAPAHGRWDKIVCGLPGDFILPLILFFKPAASNIERERVLHYESCGFCVMFECGFCNATWECDVRFRKNKSLA